MKPEFTFLIQNMCKSTLPMEQLRGSLGFTVSVTIPFSTPLIGISTFITVRVGYVVGAKRLKRPQGARIKYFCFPRIRENT